MYQPFDWIVLDLVYICRDGENEELRYSIRSAIKNLKHDNIWVVGGKPDWYTGSYIKITQNRSKYENARENIRAAIECNDISDDFILMNDDFFIMSRVDRLRPYYGGFVRDRIKNLLSKYSSSSYTALLNKSLRYLKQRGIINPLNYAIHVPFVVNKKKLLDILDLGLSWRIIYGNLYNVGGTEVLSKDGESKDVKVYLRNGVIEGAKENSLSKKFLSSQDDSFETLLPMLNLKFPNPSIYEKTYPQSDSN